MVAVKHWHDTSLCFSVLFFSEQADWIYEDDGVCKSDCRLSFLPHNGYIISSLCSFSLSRTNKKQACNCQILVLWLKGEANQRSKSVWKRRTCTDMPVCKPRLIVLSIFIQKCFFGFELRSSGRSHSGSLFINEDHEKVASWRVRYFYHSGLLMISLRQTAGLQYGITHSHDFVTFMRVFVLV